MKVLLAYQPGELRIVEMDKPVPGPKEIVAKVMHCGICATDCAIADGTLTLGDGMDPVYPVRIGHEWSGIVTEVGSQTSRLKVGDRVISDTGYSCGECEKCLEGEYQSCINGRAIGTIGNCWPGGFAEYIVMPERTTFRVPDHVALDEAALVEPASIGFYGLLRSPIGPGKNLLVVGTGPIGLGGMACARGIGVGHIMLAGRKDKKLAIGKELGADVLINMTRENLYDAVMRETNGLGPDIILDTTGAPELLNDLLYMLRGSGTIVIPGFYEQELSNVKLDRLIAKNCTMVGAAGTPNMAPKILSMLSSGHISLKPMITERYPFARAKEAFAAVKAHNDRRIKIMIDME